MLDMKFIRNNPDVVRKAIENKNEKKADLDGILNLDEVRRRILVEADKLKELRNKTTQEIAGLKKDGKDAGKLIEKMQKVSDDIKGFDTKLSEVEQELNQLLVWIPNIPHESVPIGKDATANIEVKSWGEKKEFDFDPKTHWEIGEPLGIVDFDRASKIAGTNFVLLKGHGAKLERALINFMLDVHVNDHGYTEVSPPFLANRNTMSNTGQLPKLEDDMYICERDDFFLIPTAEVPVTNIHKNEMLKAERLPVCYTAYTPCFRREAGTYGRETRGLKRVHQFDKVEMVKFVEPENSYDELESLLQNAEDILQRLGLHYRVLALSTGDLSFAAAKCYDIEVWAPGLAEYLEVSSCSNFEDFQARRANIRFRPEKGAKPEFVHTLNGSGLALPRLVIAIIENFQNLDGTIAVPEVLREYMGGLEIIK